jgi:hypothetical protein
MRRGLIQYVGIAWTLIFGAGVVWLYSAQPASVADVATKASVTAGTYEVDAARFREGHALFVREQYRAARDEWLRADPERRDARTQFYTAYAFYREGWGRIGSDDALFRQGLEAVNRAISLSPGGALVVDDPELKLRTAAELKVELETGLELTADDFNPLKVFRERK